MSSVFQWQQSLRGNGSKVANGTNKSSAPLANKANATLATMQHNPEKRKAPSRRPSVPCANHENVAALKHRRQSVPNGMGVRHNGAAANCGKPAVPNKTRKLSVAQPSAAEAVRRRKITMEEPKKPAINRTSTPRKSRMRRDLASLELTDLSCLLKPEAAGAHPEPIKSPVPLPAGVECIDPVEDDGLFQSWPEFVHYCRQQEKDIVYAKEELRRGANARAFDHMRAMIVDWLLELSHYYRVAQETLYHSVRLIDSTLAKRTVRSDHMQLLAIAAFLIATKLEEYYPPGIDNLLRMTEDSYTTSEVLKMELELLNQHDFKVYAVEPMVFLNRFIRAAFREKQLLFRNLCFFFVDCLVAKTDFLSTTCSLKAASAVLCSLLVLEEDRSKNPATVWTPTLIYYTCYSVEDLDSLATAMLDRGQKLLEAIEEGKWRQMSAGLTKKYRSVSRHGGLLQRTEMTIPAFERARKMLKEAVEASIAANVGDGLDDAFQD